MFWRIFQITLSSFGFYDRGWKVYDYGAFGAQGPLFHSCTFHQISNLWTGDDQSKCGEKGKAIVTRFSCHN